MRSRRIQMILLAVLGLLLVYIVYITFRPTAPAPKVAFTDGPFVPLTVENPALRLDLLASLKKLEYQGSQRNIFSATPPPPPTPPAPPASAAAKPPVPTGPPPVPPLTVPAVFFGYVTDTHSGVRRAFFSEGDEVYVVGIGEVLLGRFRLLQIGNSTAEMEETGSGRRATLTMQEPGQS